MKPVQLNQNLIGQTADGRDNPDPFGGDDFTIFGHFGSLYNRHVHFA